MINLDQSIAKVKWEIENTTGVDREELIETIMHEDAGKGRKTLLAWLNEQVETYAADIVVPATAESEPVEPVFEDAPTRGEPEYRSELRGGVWCLFDTVNGELRKETFDNKGDAQVFITRLEAGEDLDEPYFHKSSE